MDVLYFFQERTRFVRRFYDTAAQPFETTKLAIDNGQPPFNDPPYSEDSEPAYLSEWLEADEALEILGRTCLSMLSSSLQLYFQTWERQLSIQLGKEERKTIFKRGMLNGYLKIYEQFLGISRKGSPADLELIEQITLARNCDQHPERIATMRVTHSEKDRRKYPTPFFINEFDSAMLDDQEMAGLSFLAPTVYVSREHLTTAIEEIEKLAEWLEEYMLAKRWGR